MNNPDVIKIVKSMDVIIYGILVIGFLVLHRLIKELIHFIEASGGLQADPQAQISQRSRIICAQAGDKFASLLVASSVSFTLALGMYKFFNSVASLLLPDHTLGVTLLVSYCSIFMSFQLLWQEFRGTWRIIFPPSPSPTNSNATQSRSREIFE